MPGKRKRYTSAYASANKYARGRAGSAYARRPRSLGVAGAPLATRGFRGGYGSRMPSSRSEKKVSDIGVGSLQVNTTGTVTLLHIPTLGTDYTNRIGRKTLCKSIYVRGRVNLESATNYTGGVLVAAQSARMIVFEDCQPNGAAPGVTDLLVSADPSSQLNLNNRDRFKILKDKVWFMDGMSTTSTSASQGRQGYSFKIYKKLNVETIFNATNGGTIADITSGALFMLWIGSAAAGVNTDTNASLSTRVRFIDN